MNVLIAPDKFKGTLSASAVCDAIEKGLMKSKTSHTIRKFPLADGGEGTLDVFIEHTKGTRIEVTVHDPLMRKIKAQYGIAGNKKTAFIEMARASGLNLLEPSERSPLKTTTFGTGELMLDAIQRKVSEIIIGIGGSATNDGAIGAAQALGLEVLDADGKAIPVVGDNLVMINRIDVLKLRQLLSDIKVTAICDVSNPFYGKSGAAYVYGPQKGASASDIEILDNGLRHVAEVIKDQLGVDVQGIPGAGAGGGFAGGAYAFFGAELKKGTRVIFDLTKFNEALAWADVVITGEGNFDSQTLQGKLVAGVAEQASSLGKKVIVVCGTTELSESECKIMQLDSVHSLTTYAGKKAALESAYEVLELLAQFEIPKRM